MQREMKYDQKYSRFIFMQWKYTMVNLSGEYKSEMKGNQWYSSLNLDQYKLPVDHLSGVHVERNEALSEL